MNKMLALIVSTIGFMATSAHAAATFVGLGSASSFAILAGSTVTNTGVSTIIGSVGVSPGNTINGFPPAVITGGVIHSADAVALQAQKDLATAYNFTANEVSDFNLTGTDLGGLTLTPGVYTFASSAQLTGRLTLDGKGDPAAVFVFQVGSALTTASNSSVVSINASTGKNVFFEIGGSATLGTSTAFEGNILALTSITLNTASTIACGRALARNGVVTLDTNTVSIGTASCDATTTGGTGGTAIPEPATLASFSAGLYQLLMIRTAAPSHACRG